MPMAWELDRRSNYFFFSPLAHLCAVTYVTEISLIVTLNNQFNSTQQLVGPKLRDGVLVRRDMKLLELDV